MPDSNKVNMLRGDIFGLHVAAWRVATAIRASLQGDPAPAVTVEAPKHMAPWEDVVERFEDGRIHRWQVKSGNFPEEILSLLLQGILNDDSFETAHLVGCQTSHVSNLGSLVGLQRTLGPLRRGASLDSEDRSAWATYLRRNCGEKIEALARRLDIIVLRDLESPLENADEELRKVYEPSAVPSVRAELLKEVELCVGNSLVPRTLRQGVLKGFEQQIRADLPEPRADARRQYLDALQSALENRRILRGLFIGVLSLRDVWTPIRLTTGSGEELDADELVQHLRPGEVHVVLAPVGAGKTELLARVALKLAADARADLSAPLPLLIRARDAVSLSKEKLAEAAERTAFGTAESALRLLTICTEHWILLVDGVDEAQCGAEIVDSIAHRFRQSAVIAAARPTVGRATGGGLTFTIERWRPTDGQRFVDLCADNCPANAANLRNLVHLAPDLLTRPLTATLAAFVVSEGGFVPRNRTLLFRSAIPKLVELWAGCRNLALRWDEIAVDIRGLSLRFVQGHGDTVSRGELESIARRVAADRSECLIRSTQIDFGLLVQVDGQYEFLLRSIAEYLAGERLASDDNELLEAAKHMWGLEPVRHALALLADDEPERHVRLLSEMVSLAQKPAEFSFEALRTLMAAVYAVSDTDQIQEPLTSKLAGICYEAISNEMSPWRSDRMVEPISELAARGGACWDLLESRIVSALTDPREPGDYYNAQKDWSIEQWCETLCHCDPGVRCVAVRRLALYANEPSVTWILVTMLLDTPALPFWGEAPAIEAGLALRYAIRGGPIDLYLDDLRVLSSTSGQLSRAAAAVALHPNEQDPSVLASALSNGGGGNYVPEEIVQQLGESRQGAEALDAGWPGWRSYTRRLDRLGKPDRREPPPPSRLTRFRLVRASRHAIARNPELSKVLVSSLNTTAKGTLFEAMCEVGLLSPSILTEQLFAIPASQFPQLSPGAQDNLALVLVRELTVRNALLAKWKEFLRDAPASRLQFPGRALEGLVVSGDYDAIEAYAEWLPSSMYTLGLFRVPPPDSRVLDRPRIREVGNRQVVHAWTYATKGILNLNGDRKWLAHGSAVNVLEMLSAIWMDNTDIIRDMFTWLSSDNGDDRSVALRGLQHAVLNDDQRGALVEQIQSILKSPNVQDRHWVIPQALRTASKQGLLSELRSDVEELVRVLAPSAITAICVLQKILTHDETRALIARVVERNIEITEFDDIGLELLREMVALAPDAWATMVLRHVKTRSGTNLGLIVPIFELLPIRQKRVVAKELHALVSDQVLPWCSHRLDNDAYRPLDLVERFLFDAGIE